MPIYDLKCPSCNIEEKNFYARKYGETKKCKKCNRDMQRMVSRLVVDVFPADGIFLENVSPEGKRFMSRREMRDYEKETGTMIGCLH